MAAGGKRGTRPRGATWRRGERTDGAGRAQSSGAARQGAVEPARLLPYGDVELAAIAVHEKQGRRSGLVLVETQRTGNIGRHVLDGQAEGTLVLSAGSLRAVLRVILHARHAGLQRHGL